MKGRLGGQKGFTLIEMAIVLVIIGIILAAVLKGQDLITNAKSKQFVSNLQAWQLAVTGFMDMTKRLPGDQNNNGVIGDGASDQVSADMKTMSNPPLGTITVGQNSFFVYLGANADTPKKNVLLVCASTDCNTGKFNTEQIRLLANFATTTDNVDDVRGPYGTNTNSKVYGISSAPTTVPANGDSQTAQGVPNTPAGAGTNGNWSWLNRPITSGSTDITGLVYILQ